MNSAPSRGNNDEEDKKTPPAPPAPPADYPRENLDKAA
jgi:hypothetical protein